MLSLGSFCAAGEPTVSLDVSVGFNGVYRAGAWSPVFVTLDSSTPRAVVIELDVPHDSAYSMLITQQASIGPSPTVLQLHAPVPVDPATVMVTVRDSATGRALAGADLASGSTDQNLTFGGAGTDEVLICVTGPGTLPAIDLGSLRRGSLLAGRLSPARLPAAAVGYQSLDVLFLCGVELSRLDSDVQQAIADWVGAGGRLVVWPGTNPLPARTPIIDLLPAEVGENAVTLLAESSREQSGLPPRFEKLPVRRLAPRAGAVALPLLGGGVSAYWIDRGLGRVLVLPVDPTMLVFDSAEPRVSFWRAVFAPLLDPWLLSEPNPQAGSPQVGTRFFERPEWLAAQATSALADEIGQIPGMGQFGFSYVLLILLGLMFVVGPVDWFLLKWMGRQPWTLFTTTGWIALVTLGSVYIGSLVRSGELHLRSMQLVEQADGKVVAQANMVVIYSPRSQRYELSAPGEAWWRPASSEPYPSGSGRLLTRIPFHQTRNGNLPAPMPIPVWSIRLLRADELAPAPAWVAADLKLVRRGGHWRLTGTIRNLGQDLSEVILSTRHGSTTLSALPGGQSVTLDTPVTRREAWSVAPFSADEDPDSPSGAMAAGEQPPILTPWANLFRVNMLQDDRMRQRFQGNGSEPVAVLVGVTQPVADSPFAIRDQQALREHRRALRAMLPIAVEDEP